MQVKKFLGENTVSVMALIRKEFGDDAIILQTNKVKTGGFLGFFQKEEVEILAALDNEGILERKNKKDSNGKIENNLAKNTQRNFQSKKNKSTNNQDMDFKYHIDTMNDMIKNRRDSKSELGYKNDTQVYPVKTDDSFDDEAKEVKNDINEIKNAVRELKKKINDTFKTPQEEEELVREEEYILRLRKLGISDDLKNEVLDMFADYIRVDFSKRL